MKTQHTPGPWQIDSTCNWKVVTGHDADGEHELIAECGFIENARLIAAAPELLEACRLAFDEACKDNKNQTLIDALDAAISKATGGQIE